MSQPKGQLPRRPGRFETLVNDRKFEAEGFHTLMRTKSAWSSNWRKRFWADCKWAGVVCFDLGDGWWECFAKRLACLDALAECSSVLIQTGIINVRVPWTGTGASPSPAGKSRPKPVVQTSGERPNVGTLPRFPTEAECWAAAQNAVPVTTPTTWADGPVGI